MRKKEELSFAAEASFHSAIEDAHTLLRLYDDLRNAGPGRPPEKLEVLKRSALILIVTAWESFIEDIMEQALDSRLHRAQSPKVVSSIFNSVSKQWLDENPKPPDLIEWTGEKWKERISRSLMERLERFHTPSSENVRKLSKTFWGFDLTQHWESESIKSPAACNQLDELIARRGEIVHRAKGYGDRSDIRKSEIEAAIKFISSLFELTVNAAEKWAYRLDS